MRFLKFLVIISSCLNILSWDPTPDMDNLNNAALYYYKLEVISNVTLYLELENVFFSVAGNTGGQSNAPLFKYPVDRKCTCAL